MPTNEFQSAKDLLDVKIKVNGVPIIDFGDLVVDEYLKDPGNFSFTWYQKQGAHQTSHHESFFKKNLGKEVQIEIGKNFMFKGIVCSICCLEQDQLQVAYSLSGRGLLIKMGGPPVCHSFSEMKLGDIIEKVAGDAGIKGMVSPSFSEKIDYTVQYNQTPLEFVQMLVTRYGEWMYYDGQQLVVKKPAGGAVLTLEEDESLFNLQFSGQLVHESITGVSFDIAEKQNLVFSANKGTYGEFLNAAVAGGADIYKAKGNLHVSMAHSAIVNNKLTENSLKANQIGGVSVSGSCLSPALRLGSKVSLKSAGGSLGDYIITEVHHNCNADQNYINSFSAVDANAVVPPYANPDYFPICMPQPAMVTKNDNDPIKLDRIKVKFPWQDASANEESCWIPVLSPYAGESMGFRVLPEINDLVMVGFIDNNAERPYIMGSFFNKKAVSRIKDENNDIKSFVTKGKGKIEWNDKEGTLDIESKEIITIQTVDKKVSITLDNKNKKFKIDSEWDIEISTKGNMKLSATKNVEIDAKANVTVKGIKVALEATGAFEAKGGTAKLEGSGMVEVTASGKASLKGGITEISGGLVKIN